MHVSATHLAALGDRSGRRPSLIGFQA